MKLTTQQADSHSSRQPLKQSIPPKNGFTLLEVILAMAIISILIGSVFTITNSSVLLSQSVLLNQSEYRQRVAFDDYLNTLFINLPFDTKFELTEESDGLQFLTIQNPGTYYPSDQNDLYASKLIISTTKNRDGLLDLKVTWNSSENTEFDDISNSKQEQSLILMGDLTAFSWEIYSIKDDSWYSTWSTELLKPSHIKISYRTSSEQDDYTRTFWIPPKAKIK